MGRVVPKVSKTCVICGKQFDVPWQRAETAKTCSFECCGKLTAQRYAAARAKKICPICGVEFSVPKCHEDRTVTCSRKCQGKLPRPNQQHGEAHYLWKGGRSTHADGYVYVRSDEFHPFATTGFYVFEHRLIVEGVMREEVPDHPFLFDHNGVKYLRPEISVHHINENKRDNRLSNLIACTLSSHRLIHNGKPPVKGETWPEVEWAVGQPTRVSCTCKTCGKEFVEKRSTVNRGGGKFCNRDCYKESLSKR
jgi:hypothetical protein